LGVAVLEIQDDASHFGQLLGLAIVALVGFPCELKCCPCLGFQMLELIGCQIDLMA